MMRHIRPDLKAILLGKLLAELLPKTADSTPVPGLVTSLAQEHALKGSSGTAEA